ncbi:hypothetical protein A3A93_04325 [Candidatus Roizmanbacteria bacterium RIFCSPLOWO2_01_FULL_38_12]|uniref:Cohesin domain-containing protein n=1 Tax=Candidatus Roizmanbacteria bacterium RIFCSPLOWO2_01_FULL_38_12 TaxID=1802061 RepID=A0A1F7IXB7_9BACT|nr:MAG: hypothetical protein A2861_01170 [Candidatus Roizmanbacteria bacterium RIFCSPHIGHO2_01_FULL_38_15]OGK35466.1 MAG: hypothetical protein A3F59_00830 [Candidatus Roizmanbacteria bacterium RIFCSPHIGHO2_12_FULL_38_13]OGK47999.1 MAG: hypothetical protein A3A93_04325 [Candidatus Roizmanbacteria bacterium RIFCSPLOWO2_01_FULL_38_12]
MKLKYHQKIQKLLSFFVISLLLLIVLKALNAQLTVYAAAPEINLLLESKTTVAPSEEFNVTLKLSNQRVDGIQVVLKYDKSKFEYFKEYSGASGLTFNPANYFNSPVIERVEVINSEKNKLNVLLTSPEIDEQLVTLNFKFKSKTSGQGKIAFDSETKVYGVDGLNNPVQYTSNPVSSDLTINITNPTSTPVVGPTSTPKPINPDDLFGKVTPPPGGEAFENPHSGLGRVIIVGIRLVLIVGSIATLIYLLYGAYLWVSSQGDEDKLNHARLVMTHAVIGIILMIVAITIFGVVTNDVLGIIRRNNNGDWIFGLPSINQTSP